VNHKGLSYWKWYIVTRITRWLLEMYPNETPIPRGYHVHRDPVRKPKADALQVGKPERPVGGGPYTAEGVPLASYPEGRE
jgi:hypothetical protein